MQQLKVLYYAAVNQTNDTRTIIQSCFDKNENFKAQSRFNDDMRSKIFRSHCTQTHIDVSNYFGVRTVENQQAICENQIIFNLATTVLTRLDND